MKPIHWLALGTLLLFAVVLYTSSSSAQLIQPPEFVLQWRTGHASQPWGIVVGDNDLVYVSLYLINIVRIYTREGEEVHTIGTQGSLPGQFLGPIGLALGPNGNLYVADSANLRVQVFTPDGEFVREFSHPQKHEVSFRPWGITVDAAGNVYVSVLNEHEVHKFDAEGNFLFTFGGFGPNPGQFVGPTGMAISEEDSELYIVDSLAFRVQVFTLDGEVKRTWGTLCDIYFTPGRGCVDPDGDGPLESGDGQFSSPWGVALDEMGRVYITDSANKRVQVFTPEGEFITKWGELGTEAGNFDNNIGIDVDSHGEIFVADLNNNRVQRFAFAQPENADSMSEDGDSSEDDDNGDGGENGDDPPVVLSISVPEVNQVGGRDLQGSIAYSDLSGDLAEAQLRVIDGKYDPTFIDLSGLSGLREGQFTFNYSCPIPQQLVLKLELVDAQGNRSDPERIDIACGEPPIGNYSAEQETARETTTTLDFNLVILDDGLTTLSNGAQFPGDQVAVGSASDEIQRAIENSIVPAVTGIWDQCGVAFELGSLLVVRPDEISLSNSTLDDELFFRTGPMPEVALDEPGRDRPLEVLTDALEPIENLAESLEIEFDPDLLTVYIAGARIVRMAGDEEHFGGVTTLDGSVSLVRWDDVFITNHETVELIPPTRVITAIAHEIGHNFGLIHSNDDDSAPSVNDDPLNLMLSVPEQPTAVPPQPTVNLVEEQCIQAEPRVSELSLNQMP